MKELVDFEGVSRITSHLVMTGDLGVSGNLFGGKVMAWMDEAAAIYALWATGSEKVVTRRFSEILFDKPVHNGELLEFYCGRPRKGRTSVTFDIVASVGDDVKFQAECTFVAVNKDGSKKEIDWTGSPLGAEHPGN